MPKPKEPKTAPECKQLHDIVTKSLEGSVWLSDREKEAAFVALKRLRKNRCVKSLEYIIQYSCGTIGSDFWRDICEKATEYLNELS